MQSPPGELMPSLSLESQQGIQFMVRKREESVLVQIEGELGPVRGGSAWIANFFTSLGFCTFKTVAGCPALLTEFLCSVKAPLADLHTSSCN